MIAGDEGTRPAAGREDDLLGWASTVDAFAQRYGWTVEQIDATPQVLLERLPVVWKIRQQRGEKAQKMDNMKKLAMAMAKGQG